MFRRSIDLNLLRVLHLLLAECSVSKVADILGQSQPAVSASLRRLRDCLEDPLLVRSGSRMVLTERGRALRPQVARAIGELENILDPVDSFDASASRREVRLVADNCLSAVLVPKLVALFRRVAPNMRLEIGPMPEPDQLHADLEAGATQLIIGNWPNPQETLRYAPLFETDIVCMMRAGHPLAGRGRLSMEELLSLEHVSPTQRSQAHVSPIDGRLAEMGLKSVNPVTVPEYALAAQVVAQTDLVFSTGRIFANSFAANDAIALVDVPEVLGRMKFYMLWHEAAHNSPVNRWLRNLVRTAAADLEPADSASRPLALLGRG